jgi:5'-3' exonuclease
MESTGMEYGFMKALESLEHRYDSRPILCWDARSSRHKVYEGYKSRQTRVDKDRLKKFKQALETAYPWCWQEEMEADDLIAGICKATKDKVIIVTKDKDMLQLVTKDRRIRCLYSWGKKEVWHDWEYTVYKYGVTPDKMVIYQAITGDAVDNIPGAGVSKQNAAYVIAKSTDPREICNHAIWSDSDHVKLCYFFEDGNYKRNLELVTLKTPKVKIVQPTKDWAFLKDWFERMEIFSLQLCEECGWMPDTEF